MQSSIVGQEAVVERLSIGLRPATSGLEIGSTRAGDEGTTG
jgi:hypothetical protein